MTDDRKPRCLRLVVNSHGKNQCPNERLPGSDLCSHHLGQAVAEFREITTAAGDAD